MLANGGVETAADMARCLAETLQPHMIEAATPCAGGCSPMPNPSPNPNQARCLAETRCDGVMLAEAALENPSVFEGGAAGAAQEALALEYLELVLAYADVHMHMQHAHAHAHAHMHMHMHMHVHVVYVLGPTRASLLRAVRARGARQLGPGEGSAVRALYAYQPRACYVPRTVWCTTGGGGRGRPIQCAAWRGQATYLHSVLHRAAGA